MMDELARISLLASKDEDIDRQNENLERLSRKIGDLLFTELCQNSDAISSKDFFRIIHCLIPVLSTVIVLSVKQSGWDEARAHIARQLKIQLEIIKDLSFDEKVQT
jgi:hypothetical protein